MDLDPVLVGVLVALVLASGIFAPLIISDLSSGLSAARARMRGVSGARTALAEPDQRNALRRRIAQADQPDALVRRIHSGPPHRVSAQGSGAGPFRLETSQASSGVSSPPLAILPVTSLAGLPISRPGTDWFRLETSQARPYRRVRTRPLVSLPVSSLAGLSISRPVLEGRLRRRKYGNRATRRRAVRRAVSGHCPACQENRARGRNYCLECSRRVAPFLS